MFERRAPLLSSIRPDCTYTERLMVASDLMTDCHVTCLDEITQTRINLTINYSSTQFIKPAAYGQDTDMTAGAGEVVTFIQGFEEESLHGGKNGHQLLGSWLHQQ